MNPTRYPTVGHDRARNPLQRDEPLLAGARSPTGPASLLLVFSLAYRHADREACPANRFRGRRLYGLGLAALATGIGLEIYGFYLRVRITGWAPVTNMYETVIWVALVAAVLSFIFEMIYRKVFIALAGSAVALLGTITAANVPLLDPSIKSLQPVLRSNFWLTIHVLTEVSSYAAFALAWMLGLIATIYYLTATYRRSPRFLELALPLMPGLPLLVCWRGWRRRVVRAVRPAVDDRRRRGLFQLAAACWAATLCFTSAPPWHWLGETITLTGLLALGGEVLNRMTFHPEAQPETAAGEAQPGQARRRGAGPCSRPISIVKPLSNFIYRAMQVGVLLIAAGTILGGVWADYSWGRFWGWDPKEVWALITLLVYLIPLHGRFAGWVSTFGLVVASVVCFLSVIMAWYGVNFVLGVGLHSYGFVEGGSQGMMLVILLGVLALPVGSRLAAGSWVSKSSPETRGRRSLADRLQLDSGSIRKRRPA